MSDFMGKSRLLPQTNFQHKLFDPVSFLKGGGGKTESHGTAGLKRAKTSSTPKVVTDHTGMIQVTRSGGTGARQLQRMTVASPVPPKTPRSTVQTGTLPTTTTTPTRTGGTTPPTTTGTMAPSSTPRGKITELEQRAGRLLDEVADLHGSGGTGPSTEDLLHHGETAEQRVDFRKRGDTALTDAGKLLKSLKEELRTERARPQPDPATIKRLETEIRDVGKLRRTIVTAQVGVEFGGLADVGRRPLPRGGAILVLYELHGPGRTSAEPNIVTRALIDRIADGIDAFDRGAETVPGPNGPLDLKGFKTLVDDVIAKTGLATDRRLGQSVAEGLGRLSEGLALKIAAEGTTDALLSLLDKAPDFPVSSALRSIATAFPGIRSDGGSHKDCKLQAAALGVATIVDMIAAGEDLPGLQGLEPKPLVPPNPDNTFDTAYLKLKLAGGEDRAVTHFGDQLTGRFSRVPTETLFAAARKSIDQLTVKERAELLDYTRAGGLPDVETAHRMIDRWDVLGWTVPDEGQIAAARKDSGALTVADRSKLMNYVASGHAPDIETARRRIVAFGDEADRLRGQSRVATSMRHELNGLNRNLGDVLFADRRRLFHPTTWGDKSVKVFTNAPNSVVKDETLLTALRTFGNQSTGKDVIILFARLSTFERGTLALEQELFGSYPNLSLGEPIVDPEKPLAHLGISNEALKRIGVPIGTRDPQTGAVPDTVKEVLASVEQMGRQGIRNFNDAENALSMIGRISKIVLKSDLTQEMIRHCETESARAVGQHLLGELLGDAERSYRTEHGLPPGEGRPGVDDPIVVQEMRQRTRDVELSYLSLDDNRDVDTTRLDRLKNQAKTFDRIEGLVVDAYRDVLDVDGRVKETQAFLKEKSQELGLDLDHDAPRGLKSARLLLEALRDHDIYSTYKTDGPRKRRDTTLEKLKGFDLESMRRPWQQKFKSAFGGGKSVDLSGMDKARLEDLRKIAQAIVFLREDAPLLRESAVKEVEKNSAMLDELVRVRRQDNPKAIGKVNDMVRLAVLNEWKTKKSDLEISGGKVKEGFNPADPDVRKKIEKTLAGWGLDLESFRPEIDEILHARMTVDDLIGWAKDSSWSDATIEHFKETHPKTFSKEGVVGFFKDVLHDFTPDGLLHCKTMDDDTKNTMISMLSSFQEGDKLDLKAGQKLTLDTGKLAVEPSGLVGVKAKLSGSHIGQFEVERGSDGFKLHLRSGFGGSLGADLIVGKKFKLSEFAEARLELTAGGEIGGSKLTGVSLTFENNEKGVKALVSLVETMIDGNKAKIGDLSGATDVGRASETRTRIAGTVQGTGRLQVGGKGQKLSGKVDNLGVGVSGQVGVTVARGTKGNVTRSNNETTYKGETEYSLTLNASLNFYANLYNPVNMGTGALQNAFGGQSKIDGTFGKDEYGKSNVDISSNTQSVDIIGVGGTTTLAFTDKWKQVTDQRGFFTKAEQVRQSNGVQQTWERFAVCGDGVEKLLSKKGNEEFAKNFQVFMGLAKGGDFVQVTYALKKDEMERANEFVRLALQAKSEGRTELAAELMERAQTVVDNGTYVPDKIAIVKTSVQKSEISNVNARFIRWDTIADSKSEHTEVTLKFPA